jgi:hypothetical protein
MIRTVWGKSEVLLPFQNTMTLFHEWNKLFECEKLNIPMSSGYGGKR